MKKPSIATTCQSSVLRTSALDLTSDVNIVFNDNSTFLFRAVAGDPKPKVEGAENSLAHQLNAQATKYTYLAAGVQIHFEDGSSCSLNFGKRIVAKPGPEILRQTFGATEPAA